MIIHFNIKENFNPRQEIMNYFPILILLMTNFNKNIALDLDLLVLTSEIDLAKQTTTTSIYFDFKIFTLTTEETQLIFDMFKIIREFITSEPTFPTPALSSVNFYPNPFLRI